MKSVVFAPVSTRIGPRKQGLTGPLGHFYLVIRLPKSAPLTLGDVAMILEALGHRLLEDPSLDSTGKYRDLGLVLAAGDIETAVTEACMFLFVEVKCTEITVVRYEEIGERTKIISIVKL